MNIFLGFGGCVKASPVFCRDIERLSARYSDSRQRFDTQIIAGGVRCSHGYIQVLVCRPFSRRLRPFPTTFWLTCPYLIRQAGMIESHGGVRELEEYMTIRRLGREWREYNLIHQVIRLRLLDKFTCRYTRKYHNNVFRSVIRSGIGGMKLGENICVKCLHLQTASFIALGRHPAGEWLKEKGLCGECTEALCAKKLP